MSFFRNRQYSLIVVTVIAVLAWGWSGGGLLAQTTYDIKSYADLVLAINQISDSTTSGHTFTININQTVPLTGDLPELTVPAGVTVDIQGSGTINGQSSWHGLVIETEGLTSVVNISQITFKDCMSSGGDDGGLGGALSVRGTTDTVTLTDVKFSNSSGGGMYLDGTNVIFEDSGTGYTVTGNISDLSAKSGFDKWHKTNGVYDLETSAGGVTISDGSEVTLTGNNTYAGVTTIGTDATGTGATLIANGTALKDSNGKNLTDAFGKTIHNAIGDLSEVYIVGTGKLQLNQSETIGFLSNDGSTNGKVDLNGKTLIISGDEDPEQFGQGVNPATGNPVDSFKGQFINDVKGAELIKTGTGRLTLGNNNTTTEEFKTTIYQGTIVLDNAKGLGAGDVTIRNIDTGTGSHLRNVIESGSNLAGPVMNNFKIEKSGTNLDGVQQNFNAFVIGGAKDIQFGNAGVEGGRITGGNLVVNMNTEKLKVILANDGFDGTSNVASQLNSYDETQIKRGTVVAKQYILADGTTGSTLGKGSVRAVGLMGEAILSAGTDGMTISNNLVMDNGSALTLTNESTLVVPPVTDYAISGSTSGGGALFIDLANASDTVTLTGGIGHGGATRIDSGKLVIDPANPRTSTTLHDLFATSDGALEVTTGDLNVDIGVGKEITYSGTIDLTGTGQTLTKTGAGTWVFNTAGTIDAITVSAGALKLDANMAVYDVTLTNNGQLIINAATVTLDNLTSDSWGTNVTINDNCQLNLDSPPDTVYMNTWTGGELAKVQFNDDTTLQNIYQNPSNWKGTMEVATNKTLTVNSPGGLGDANSAEVTLNSGSTLVIDTYQPGYRSVYPDQINVLNLDGGGTSIVTVNDNNDFITKTINNSRDGASDVRKTGDGLWTMLGNSIPTFDGEVELNAGGIYLKRVYNTTTEQYDYISNWGDGTLNVTGDSYLLVDTGELDRAVNGKIEIDTDKTLTIGLVQNDPTFGKVTFTDIDGDGGVDYYGTGTMVYDGSDVKYTGDTNIYGGTLDLQNNVALGGNLTVWDGGTLTGTGTNIIGGTLTFDAGSKLIADYTQGSDPSFEANGVTIVDGAVAHVIADKNNLWDEHTIPPTILVKDTAATHTDDDPMFWFTNNIQGQRTVGEWDGNDLKIWFIDFDYEDNITTANANSMVPYLYAIVDNTTPPPTPTTRGPVYPIETLTSQLLKALENSDPNQYDYALLEIGGQINASMVTAQMQTTTSMFQSITKQLYPVSYFTEPCEEGFAVSNGTIYRGQSVRSGWTGWTSGLGALGSSKDQTGRGTYGYDFNSYGMSLGIEPTAAMSPNRVGFFYTWNYTEIDTKKTIGRGNVNDHFFGGYGRFVDSMGYTSFVAGFGFDKYKTWRSVTKPVGQVGISRADIDGWQGGLYIERGLGRMSRYGLQPYAGLQYLYAETSAFTETGDNPYKLESDATATNSLRTNLGIRLARQICRVKRGNMYVSGNVSWMHEFLDANCVMTSKWGATDNPSTFDVRGHSLGRDWGVAGCGMDWQLRQNLSVFGSYDLQANGRQWLNVANAGARIQW